MEKDHLSIKGGIHVYIAMQNVILTFSSLLNHPPLKTYNVKNTIFIRNRYLLLIRNTLKKVMFLDFKRYLSPPPARKVSTAKQNDSEPVLYQTKNSKGDTATGL